MQNADLDKGPKTEEFKLPSFKERLKDLINEYSMENSSDTPDFILRDFLMECLAAFDKATVVRDNWYRPEDEDTE